MTVGRAARRAERKPRVAEALGWGAAEAGLDVLELLELAWHDCYGEVTPPEDVVDDVLACSRGHLLLFVKAARLAVTDRRDLRVAADAVRRGEA